MSDKADLILDVGCQRALFHIRHGRTMDARFALEVAMRAAERLDDAEDEGAGDR